MRITDHSSVVALLVFPAVLVLMGCAYLAGYGGYLDEGYTARISLENLAAFSARLWVGFAFVSLLFAEVVRRLIEYSKGRRLNRIALVCMAMSAYVIMYAAIYDEFRLREIYPFATFFLVSILVFRYETRPVAALLFSLMIISFYGLCAKELGERDAKRCLETNREASIMSTISPSPYASYRS